MDVPWHFALLKFCDYTGVTFSLAPCSTTPHVKIETVAPFLYNHDVNGVLHSPGAYTNGYSIYLCPLCVLENRDVSKCYSRNILIGNLVVSSSDQSLLSGAVRQLAVKALVCPRIFAISSKKINLFDCRGTTNNVIL